MQTVKLRRRIEGANDNGGCLAVRFSTMQMPPLTGAYVDVRWMVGHEQTSRRASG